jgi:hypothetical protein
LAIFRGLAVYIPDVSAFSLLPMEHNSSVILSCEGNDTSPLIDELSVFYEEYITLSAKSSSIPSCQNVGISGL